MCQSRTHHDYKCVWVRNNLFNKEIKVVFRFTYWWSTNLDQCCLMNQREGWIYHDDISCQEN
ncbi:hypothetical protein HanIR_Chr11g0503421 [Helianthus annuus]|nr:hypothetical protein HanIR_Chr11g0503421 [Helianthus annuus]